MDKLNEAHKQGVVLGLRDVAGVSQRLDIDVMLMEQPDTFNLFLIALMELQGMELKYWKPDPNHTFSSDDIMSWFKIAGIHGLPNTAWSGEKDFGKGGTVNPGDPGYCAHSTPTFAPWHRPYLSMLEQTLFRQVVNVAKRFSDSPSVTEEDKKKYTAAAQQFRLPYWDYYRPRGYEVTFPGVVNGSQTTAPYDYHAPQIFTMSKVMVKRLPDNELISMDNPFFQFSFKAEDSVKIQWEKSGLDMTLAGTKDRTIRHGGSDTEAIKSLNDVLNKIREDEMRCSLVMIEEGAYSDFKAFSSDGVALGQKWKFKDLLKNTTGSIEGLHNDYHVFTGGFQGTRQDIKSCSGHMSCVPVAAFDPIFWFHHCQIDRLLAIWQAANGKEHWFNELNPDKQHLGDANLLPFRKWPLVDKTDLENRYWTSNRAWDTTEFGYTYPETANGRAGAQVRDEFARKYAWSRRLDVNQDFGTPPDDMQPLRVAEAQVFQYTSGHMSKDVLKDLGPLPKLTRGQAAMAAPVPTSKVSQEWYIDVVVERMALNGSYTIFYIIGDVDGKSGHEWVYLPGFVGVSHIFAAPREACDNCGHQEDQAHLVTSTTSITSLLLDYVKAGKLRSMDPEDVEPFLVKKLKWRVQALAGDVIDPRNLDKHHTLKLGISLKTAPKPGEDGNVEYSFFPQIIDEIIAKASPAMTPLSVQ